MRDLKLALWSSYRRFGLKSRHSEIEALSSIMIRINQKRRSEGQIPGSSEKYFSSKERR